MRRTLLLVAATFLAGGLLAGFPAGEAAAKIKSHIQKISSTLAKSMCADHGGGSECLYCHDDHCHNVSCNSKGCTNQVIAAPKASTPTKPGHVGGLKPEKIAPPKGTKPTTADSGKARTTSGKR